MHILNAGRGAFLEFLRNLTPFILLTSISILTWARLDFGRIDLTNWALTLAFFGCAFIATLSFYANLSSFLDNAFSASPQLERGIRLLRSRGHRGSQLLCGAIVLTFRCRKVLLFELLVAVLIVYVALFAVANLAVSGAVTALRNGVK